MPDLPQGFLRFIEPDLVLSGQKNYVGSSEHGRQGLDNFQKVLETLFTGRDPEKPKCRNLEASE